ncbi:DUF1493 family protein [Microbulbifer sp. JMSA004]|uniref:DUF1493 family protein n=1 Tax=unclassified Microbulbifer TaxID=2619833 RepID=UPI00403AB356
MENDVIEFVSNFTGIAAEKIRLETLVNDDLAVDGDDGDEFLIEFSHKFNVDISGIDRVYFGPEGISLNPFEGIWAFLKGFLYGCKGVTRENWDDIAPLPVSVLVNSAKSGTWED